MNSEQNLSILFYPRKTQMRILSNSWPSCSFFTLWSNCAVLCYKLRYFNSQWSACTNSLSVVIVMRVRSWKTIIRYCLTFFCISSRLSLQLAILKHKSVSMNAFFCMLYYFKSIVSRVLGETGPSSPPLVTPIHSYVRFLSPAYRPVAAVVPEKAISWVLSMLSVCSVKLFTVLFYFTTHGSVVACMINCHRT